MDRYARLSSCLPFKLAFELFQLVDALGYAKQVAWQVDPVSRRDLDGFGTRVGFKKDSLKVTNSIFLYAFYKLNLHLIDY